MLLVSDEFYDGVKSTIMSASNQIFVTSAFIKVRALESLLTSVPNNVEVEIVGRWRKNDLLMKASDIDVYRACQKRGWKFGIDQNLHGKLYLVDEAEVFLGSANLTQKGMSIGGYGNVEFGTKFDAEQIDISRIRAYKHSDVVWLDDDLFRLIEDDIYSADESTEEKSNGWSTEILARLETPVEYLWVHELVFVEPQMLKFPDLDNESIAHDFEMLNLHCDNLGDENLRAQFRQTRVYNWLRYQIRDAESLNYGGLTHRLHNSLFDDPLPYRKEIKEFVSVLFRWMEFMETDYVVTKHTRTSSVRYKE